MQPGPHLRRVTSILTNNAIREQSDGPKASIIRPRSVQSRLLGLGHRDRSSTYLSHANPRRQIVDELARSNFNLLAAFWQKNSVVGLVVESAAYFLDRCVVTFGNLVLVCDEVTEYVSSVNELPTCLLEQEIDLRKSSVV